MANVEVKNKLELNTTRFGRIKIDEDRIITFTDEIPGFSSLQRFVLIPHSEESPFMWLQSIERPDIAFVVTDPGLFFKDYNITISDQDVEKLGIEEGSEDAIIVLTIVTIPAHEPKKMTANLMAPIIINSRNNIAKQVILLDSSYTTRHYLLPNP